MQYTASMETQQAIYCLQVEPRARTLRGMAHASYVPEKLPLDTHPDHYVHWKLTFEGPVARLAMNVQQDQAARDGDYVLKLNSYDLGVDIELADAIQRVRFEHPEVRCLLLSSAIDRIFCSGANIYMLGSSTHAFKVNFCKYTNETRLDLEDLAALDGVATLAAVNGTAAGGGYELALACDQIVLVDDGNSAVSFPEAPLLGVLPGTGGLTRLVDKRKVRRDRADVFSTIAEGIKGKRAVEWNLVDEVAPRSKWPRRSWTSGSRPPSPPSPRRRAPASCSAPSRRSTSTTASSTRSSRWRSIAPSASATSRCARPTSPSPRTAKASIGWASAPGRSASSASSTIVLLRLRFELPDIGLVALHSRGRSRRRASRRRRAPGRAERLARPRGPAPACAACCGGSISTARSIFAFVEPGSCFAGSLLELALAADRIYMLRGSGSPGAPRLSAAERRTADHVERAHPPRDPVPRRARRVGEVLAESGRIDTETADRAGPGDLRARRDRLGGRGPDRDRGARQLLTRRA